MEGGRYSSTTRRRTRLSQVCCVAIKSHLPKTSSIAPFVSVNLLFFCTAEMVQTGVVPSPSKARMKRVTATDGSGDALRGVCVFFLRPNPTKPVTVASISEELMCGQLDTSDGRSILEVIQEYLSEVMVPALRQGQNWGALQPLQIESFMNTLNNYINFIKGMCACMCVFGGEGGLV